MTGTRNDDAQPIYPLLEAGMNKILLLCALLAGLMLAVAPPARAAAGVAYHATPVSAVAL